MEILPKGESSIPGVIQANLYSSLSDEERSQLLIGWHGFI